MLTSKLTLLLCPLLALPFFGTAPAGEQEAVDPEITARVLAELRSMIGENYAYKGHEEWLLDSLAENHKLGSYDDLDPAQLGSSITEDLRGWTSDKHFMVAHLPRFAAELEAYAAEPSTDAEPKDDPGEAAANFGVKRAEMVSENVGLIHLDQIAFSPSTVPAFQKALAGLPEASALILDLRDNHGGSGDTVPNLLSCFFPKGEKVIFATHYWRPTDKTKTIENNSDLDGARFLDFPVFILTSKDTRSAAEALAYHLRAFGRARVVGEPSSGGAHPADMRSLGDGFVALVPMGIVTSTKTGTDWEGRGVPVDHPCEASQAEELALKLAQQMLKED